MTKKLLLADDSITIQKVIGIIFATEDYQLLVSDDGNDAFDKALEEYPDLVIADISMPGKDGFELCQAIKNEPRLAHTSVLLLPGTFDHFDESRAQDVGADGWLTKPFESQALLDKVSQLIEAAPVQLAASEEQLPVEDLGFVAEDSPELVIAEESVVDDVVLGLDEVEDLATVAPVEEESPDDIWDAVSFEEEDLQQSADLSPTVDLVSDFSESPATAVDDVFVSEEPIATDEELPTDRFQSDEVLGGVAAESVDFSSPEEPRTDEISDFIADDSVPLELSDEVVAEPAEGEPLGFAAESDQLLELDSEVDEPLELDTEVGEALELDTMVAEPLELDTEVDEPLELDTEVDEPLELDTEVDEPLELDSEVDEPLELDTEVDEPLELDTVVAEPLELAGESVLAAEESVVEDEDLPLVEPLSDDLLDGDDEILDLAEEDILEDEPLEEPVAFAPFAAESIESPLAELPVDEIAPEEAVFVAEEIEEPVVETEEELVLEEDAATVDEFENVAEAAPESFLAEPIDEQVSDVEVESDISENEGFYSDASESEEQPIVVPAAELAAGVAGAATVVAVAATEGVSNVEHVEQQLRELSEDELKEVVAKVAGSTIETLAREMLEQVVWEVVPDLAESMIREEIRKIRQGAE